MGSLETTRNGPAVALDPVSILLEALVGYVVSKVADRGLLAVLAPWRNRRRRKAIETALDGALRDALNDFSRAYPELTASFFDHHFLGSAASAELKLFFSRGQRPSAAALAAAFKTQFRTATADITGAAEDFLNLVEKRMNDHSELHPLLASRESHEILQRVRGLDRTVTRLADSTAVSEATAASLATVRATLSRDARACLKELVTRRFFDDLSAPAEMDGLVRRLGADLSVIDDDVKVGILRTAAIWACASPDGVTRAREYTRRIQAIQPSVDVRRIEAAVLVAEHDVDSALRILRSIDSSDARRQLLHVHLHNNRADAGVQWLDSLDCSRPDLFDENGWGVAAITYVAARRWDRALETVRGAMARTASFSPLLSYLEGVIEFKLSLPDDLRSPQPEQLTLPDRTFFPQDPTAHARRERAAQALQKCEATLRALGLPSEALKGIDKQRLLVLLADDTLEAEGVSLLRTMLADEPLDALLLSLAVRLRLDLDLGTIREKLRTQELTGGLDNLGVNALLLILEYERNWPGVRDLLLREKARITAGLLSVSEWTVRLINAYIRLEDYSSAASLLEADKHGLGDDYPRFVAMISQARGHDPVDSLREQYESTRELFDLENLVNVLRAKRRWTDLRDHAIALVRQVPNSHHLSIAADCLVALHDDAQLIELLEQNLHIVVTSPQVRLYYAQVLFHRGRFEEAEAHASALREQAPEPAAALLARVHLCSGHWEKLPPLAKAEEAVAGQRSAEHLLRLGHLLSISIFDRGLAYELVQAAVARGPEDASILTGAGVLAFRLGHDADGGQWIARGAKLSGADGPVTAHTLDELATRIPQFAKRSATINELLRKGEVPLHLFCQEQNIGLARPVVAVALDNMENPDPARQPLVPIRHERRAYSSPEDLSAVGVVSADLTALLITELLGIWDIVSRRFERIYVPWSIMATLHKEIQQAEFHQPSRIKFADELHELIGHGSVLLAPSDVEAPRWLVEEVGPERAVLLNSAKASGAVVVDELPIHKAGSLGRTPADLRDYADVVRTPADVLSSLEARSSLNSEEMERARAHIREESRGKRDVGTPTALYLDPTVLPLMAEAGLLAPATRVWRLYVSSESESESQALRAAVKQAARVTELLVRLRRHLVEGIEDRKVAVLPLASQLKPEDRDLFGLPSLIYDPHPGQAVWIDDRMASKTPGALDHRGVRYPCIGTLDVLRECVRTGLMPEARRRAAERILRRANFGILPLDFAEITDLLTRAQVQAEGLTEPRDLIELRRYANALIGSRYLAEEDFGAYAAPVTFGLATLVVWCWSDARVPPEACEARASWVLDNLPVMPGYLDHLFPEGVRTRITIDQLTVLTTGHARPLGAPYVEVAPVHLKRYRSWIQERIIEPLVVSNNDAVVQAAQRIKELLEEMLNASAE